MTYSALEQRLLNDFQRDFPLTHSPFADIAARVEATEDEVLGAYRSLLNRGVVSRIGGIFRPGTVGASTLAAMEVPQGRLEEVASFVSNLQSVNHNYEREHRLNLWFVVTGDSADQVTEALSTIECATGLEVLDLPMLEAFHLDLGFELSWSGD
jgi:siroheme decarboxylase